MIGFGGLWRIFFFIFFTSILGCPFYFRGLSRSFGLLRIKHPHPVPNKCKSPTKPWFILWGVFNIYIYILYISGGWDQVPWMTVSKAKICGFSCCFTEDLSLEVDGTRLASRWPWEDTFGAWHARKIWGRRTAGMWLLIEKNVFLWTSFFF